MNELPHKAFIVKGVLRIEISLEDLEEAGTNGYYSPTDSDFNVTDRVKWAEDVRDQLNRESEDGSTLVTRMLHEAMCEAVEQGSEAVTMISEERDDENP